MHWIEWVLAVVLLVCISAWPIVLIVDRANDPCLSTGGHYVRGTVDTTTPDGRTAHVEERWCTHPDAGPP